jgi:hypothetical protein
LGKDFKEISDFFKVENITYSKLKNETQDICQQKFDEIYFITKGINPNICLKLTYTLVLLNKLFDIDTNNGSLLLILSSSKENSDPRENSLLLNTFFIDFMKIPLSLILTFFSLLILFSFSYFKQQYLSAVLEAKFFREEINFNKINFKLLDTTINTLPVKSFLLSNSQLKEQVKEFSKSTIYYSLFEYKKFFYEKVKNNHKLREKVNETLIMRNRINISIVISTFQIVIIIVLSILTNKIIAYLNLDNTKSLYTMALFSLVYMSVLIIECLKLISSIDNKRYLVSENLTSYDKKFLDEEYDGVNIEY